MTENNDNNLIAIQVLGVKKKYKLGQIGGGTLRAELQSWWAKKRGKEDPNIKLGEERLVGQEFMALNGVDLTIYKGEAVGIIGSNGAGKSTLLKLLSQVTAPTEGKIDLYGRVASMLEVGTGFNPEMTGRENVYMNGAILGMTKSEIDEKLADIIEFSEVRDFIDTPVKRYSSGMFVKLAFSVAAHLDSEIMIMDEVLAVGDIAFQAKCLDKMRRAADLEGRTVLYVSHNMNTIRKLCDRCVVLDKGKVVFEGDTESAIAIYSGNNQKIKKYNDCSTIEREPICDNNIHTTMVEVLYENEKQIIGSTLKLRIRYYSKELFEKLSFRIIIFSKQQIPIGMACTEYSIKACCGDNSVDLLVSLENLAIGEYSARIVFYEVNQYGGELLHDVVQDAFSFKIETANLTSDTTSQWKRAVWGNIDFPRIKVL